jgi:hypothetical protein
MEYYSYFGDIILIVKGVRGGNMRFEEVILMLLFRQQDSVSEVS